MPNTRYEDNFFTEFTTYSKHVEGSPSNHTGSIASEFGIRTSRKTVLVAFVLFDLQSYSHRLLERIITSGTNVTHARSPYWPHHYPEEYRNTPLTQGKKGEGKYFPEGVC